MYRHNFQFVFSKSWDQGSVFGGISDLSEVRSVLRNGKALAPAKWTGFHLNRVTDVFIDFAKELTISEGGNLNKKGMRDCSPLGNISEVLLNPYLCNRRRNYGNRICCNDFPGPTVSLVPHPRPTHYGLPWIVNQNQDHFWPTSHLLQKRFDFIMVCKIILEYR